MIVYKKKILIVDSDPEIQLFLKQELTRLDYQIFSAFNSEDGLLLFTDERPDLIIVDVVLQKLDGYSVCQEIRKISSVPIIIVTMASHISDRLMGFEVGANDYVVKPFSKKELEVRIRALLYNSVKKQPKFRYSNPKSEMRSLFVIEKPIILKS